MASASEEHLLESPQPPRVLVVFGATGDMAASKLLPALFNLYEANQLPPLRLICAAKQDAATIASTVRQSLLTQSESQGDAESRREQFLEATDLRSFSVDLENSRDFLAEHFVYSIYESAGSPTTRPPVIYYYAVPPGLYRSLTELLVDNNVLAADDMIVLEKPYGSSVTNTTELFDYIHKIQHKNLFLIDHYLYKLMIQRINQLHQKMSSDPAYELLGRVWNHRYIDHVQITISEDEGIGDRAEFFEANGTLYDMVQNHMLQLVCVIAKRLPLSWAGEIDADQSEFVSPEEAVLEAILTHDDQFTKPAVSWQVRGQFDGYQQITGVKSQSTRETFVALKLELNDPQWTGVPFFLRTGKRMSAREAHIMIKFKTGDRIVFYIQPYPRIVVRRRPHGGIPLGILIQYDEAVDEAQDVEQSASTTSRNGRIEPWHDSAYENILSDLFEGELRAPVSEEWVLRSWDLMDQIVQGYGMLFPERLSVYQQETIGPQAAHKLIQACDSDRHWLEFGGSWPPDSPTGQEG